MNIELNGITIAYDDVGAGQPVVLLHAFPLNRTMWQPTVEALHDTYRVITPDLRGLGESGLAECATPRDMADDVVALMDHLEIDQAVIGGLSMGGYVALDLMRRFPKRVKALILADTRARGDDVDTQESRQTLAATVKADGAAAIAETMVPKLLGATTQQDNPSLVDHVKSMVISNAPEGIAAASLGMAERTDSRPYVPHFQVPMLVIVGAEDTVTPYADAEALTVAVPHAHLVSIEKAGHLSNLEQPAAFNHAVLAFLQSH